MRNINQIVVKLAVIASVLLVSSSGYALDPAKDCSEAIMNSFFPEVFVNQSLSNHQIPKEKWAAINQALAEKDKSILKRAQEKAERMDPNPLRDPSRGDAAKKVFRESIQESFTEVMKANGINDEDLILTMLDEISKASFERSAECRKAGYGPKNPQQNPQQGPQQGQRYAAPQRSSSQESSDSMDSEGSEGSEDEDDDEYEDDDYDHNQ